MNKYSRTLNVKNNMKMAKFCVLIQFIVAARVHIKTNFNYTAKIFDTLKHSTLCFAVFGKSLSDALSAELHLTPELNWSNSPQLFKIHSTAPH